MIKSLTFSWQFSFYYIVTVMGMSVKEILFNITWEEFMFY